MAEESLRQLLHRHADELADKLAEISAPTKKTQPPKRPRTTRASLIPIPDELPMDEVTRQRALGYVKRAGLG